MNGEETGPFTRDGQLASDSGQAPVFLWPWPVDADEPDWDESSIDESAFEHFEPL